MDSSRSDGSTIAEDDRMRRAWMLLLPFLVLLFALQTRKSDQSDTKPFSPPDGAPGVPKEPYEEFTALTTEYGQADSRAAAAAVAAKSDGERLEALRARQTLPEKFAGRFLDLAQHRGGDGVKLEALAWLIIHCPLAREAATALELITPDCLQREGLGRICEQLGDSPSPSSETLLREIIAHNPHGDVQAQGRFSLGRLLKSRIDQSLQATDSLACAREAESLFEQVVSEGAPIRDGNVSLGELAAAELFEMRNLAVGKPVPEIEGNDLDGKSMRLSSYRGKVVVLEFWGYWCSICQEVFPYHQSLVKLFAGKPFALVGVNSDVTQEVARDVVTKLGIRWPSWYDGGAVRGGSIGRRWNVRALPTTYVLDASGVIRFKFGPIEASHDPVKYSLDSSGAVKQKWRQRSDLISQAVETLLQEQKPFAAIGLTQ
jgi:peroxiredoxin